MISSDDQLRAYFHAHLFRDELMKEGNDRSFASQVKAVKESKNGRSNECV